ncbi:7-carboxy-7-deazaguanine synthase QueE [Wohlfahrtiimonas chitiniclastica]|uniref:7-carboxy-7-deazaguanine synthase QueE n=1 Tax=Wohlfahrtiimonas chitiniclastica TaxID=400946 RepID=UPI0007B69685|nr:7-carboxy-7-deazaguanine synthase QueE [Wohlfahrtiimonas chitiniclastica]KZX36615.1 7-cyano-7-deazaguanosine (preQ0) biosynthesis protein QueE [Wohlfahrtiimonas chitiniclastica]
MNFPVLEIFGPTVQGEGMVIGRKTCFIRLAACDYQCIWCDSKFTWDGSVKPDVMTIPMIIDAVNQLHEDQVDHVTISGGNPALYKGLDQLVSALNDTGYQTAIETQGSHWNEGLKLIDEVTISPKPPSSGMNTDFKVLDQMIAELEGRNVSLKVVVFDRMDLLYAEMIHQRYPHVPMFVQAGNDQTLEADEANTSLHLLKRYAVLVDEVMRSTVLKNVRVLPQMHALLWGNRRGV